MNLWIARLGSDTSFTKDDIENTKKIAADFSTLDSSTVYLYEASEVHYLSIHTPSGSGKKNYHSENGSLLAYSGLPVARSSDEIDYRSAKNLAGSNTGLTGIHKKIMGQYSVLRAGDGSFECITDPLSIHNVFYHCTQEGTIYVSNYVPLIRLFKQPETNIEFYVTWIAAGGTYGYSTEEKDLFTLPEYGHLVWTSKDGFRIEKYSDLSEIIQPEDDWEEYLDVAAREFKNGARYLTARHQSVIPLSGGFDSRQILNMFSGFDPSKVECYTYPDHLYDKKLAPKVAGDHGISHELLKPSGIPPINVLDEFLLTRTYPFFCYSYIFGYQFHEQVDTIFNDRSKVRVKGDGGGTDYGLRKFSVSDDAEGEKAITILVDHLMKMNFLTPKAYSKIRSGLTDHYRDKYLPFVEGKGTSHKLSLMHIYLERLCGYQSRKVFNNYYVGDSYQPYANDTFLKTVFASPSQYLRRNRKGGIHHRLTHKLIDGKISPIPFGTTVHWDATNRERFKYKVKRRVIDKVLKHTFQTDTKYASVIRQKFFEQNRSYFLDILHSTKNSVLWDYFDRELLIKEIANENGMEIKKMKVYFRIIPLLKFHL